MLVSMLGSASAQAEDTWQYRLTPYLWSPSLYGDLTIDPDPTASSDTSLLDVLDFAVLLAGEARKGDWGIIGEFNYLALSEDASSSGGVFSSEMSLDGVMAGAAVAYRFARENRNFADAFAGLRSWWIDAKIDFDLLPSVSQSTSWVDPIVGLRGLYDLSDTVFVNGLAEIGGFGVGSDLQWELIGRVGYRFGDSVSAALGYRHLAIDFDDSSVVIDAVITGPFISIDFSF